MSEFQRVSILPKNIGANLGANLGAISIDNMHFEWNFCIFD